MGGGVGRDDPLARPAGVPQQPPQVIIESVVRPIPVERLPEQPWLLKTAVQADKRDELARFWLAAPEDLLPSLWSSPVGEATKSMVKALTPQTPFTPEQVATRDAIGARLQHGFQAPMAVQLLLANFLYSPPGLLTIANAEAQLPEWLISDYRDVVFIGWPGIP